MTDNTPEQGPRVLIRGPPRFGPPIALEKIRRVAAPANMFELLENAAVAAPMNMRENPIGLGVGIEAAPAAGAAAAPAPAPAAPRAPPKRKTQAELELPADFGVAAPAAAEPAPVAAPGVEGVLSPELSALADRVIAVMDKSKVEVKSEYFVPSSRRAFKQFIIQAYRRYKLPKLPEIPDPDACAKAASKKELKTFAYQSFIRDYIQRPSPYRGVLVNHGLGSGKTCTSIASIEALYQSDPSKPIYVMTPASLSPNYKGEITKCGPFIFRYDNFWTWVPIPKLKPFPAEANLLINKLGIPAYVIQKQKGGWLPDPTKASNFEALSPEQQTSIKNQIKEHIDYRFQFIHYNGVTEKTVRNWACKNPTMFDGATIVIDEVHNLIRTINNANLENFYKDEPRDLSTYVPKFCEVGKKYRISYLLYRMICNSVGCKIIALSATPIINFPQEIAILANVLAGDTRMAEASTPGLDKRAEIVRILNAHPEVDFVEVIPRPEVSTSTIRITPVPSGCRKVLDERGAFRGFIRDEVLAGAAEEIDRERDLEGWFGRVAHELTKVGISVGEARFKSVPRLPDLEKTFSELFIDKENLEVKKATALPLMARLSGLISYYKGGKADLMAKVTRDEEVFVDMSDLQLKKYTEQRKLEIDKELRQKRKEKKAVAAGAGVAAGYSEVTKSVNSTFKIFSRAACNFVFPADLDRPIPADYRDVLKMIGARVGETGDEVMIDRVGDAGEQLLVDEAAAAAAIEEGGEGDMPAAVEASAAEGNTAITYERALASAVRELKARAGEFFSAGALAQHSPKFQAILDRLAESRGPALFYSTFKTLEGVGLFGVALETQQKYKKFDIIQAGGSWTIAPETLEGGPGTSRYITYTGDEDRAKRDILLAIFNGRWKNVPSALAEMVKTLAGTDNNRKGEIAKVFMITQSGAEGISLSNVRQVHLMEPYWNYVRLDQVKGRAVRICSHMDLPPEERTVDIFTYISKFSEKQMKERSVDETLLNYDSGLTTDQNVLTLLKNKKKLADSLLDVMKKSAIDCELNRAENGEYGCYRFPGEPSMELMFHPLVEVHVAEAAGAVREAGGAAAGL
jgi:hypothetical protein